MTTRRTRMESDKQGCRSRAVCRPDPPADRGATPRGGFVHLRTLHFLKIRLAPNGFLDRDCLLPDNHQYLDTCRCLAHPRAESLHEALSVMIALA